MMYFWNKKGPQDYCMIYSKLEINEARIEKNYFIPRQNPLRITKQLIKNMHLQIIKNLQII